MTEKLRVMVVDDSNATIKKLEVILLDLGHELVLSSKTGVEAISDYQQCRPDLVTMDITMPELDGIEATKRIMELDPNALIIMVTSHGQEQKVMDAIDAGAKGYILKPIRKEKLQETIEKLINAYRK